MSDETATPEVTEVVDGANTPEAPARKSRSKAAAQPEDDRGELIEFSPGIFMYVRK